jgi:hypothetical protein
LVEVDTNRNTASRVPNRITGQFIIMRAGASGLWSISSWTDIATNPEYSWTELKAEFMADCHLKCPLFV